MTVADLLRSWLDDVAAHRVRPTTLAGYRWQCEKYVIPALGAVPVQKLTAAKIQAFYTALLDQDIKPRTIQLCHLRLKQGLAQAVKWSIIQTNPTDVVDVPTVRYKRSETWDRRHLRLFLSGSESDSLSPLWLILARTGMRRGEALGLRWRDVDLERGRVTIQQSVPLLNGAPIIQAPKTASGRRTIPVDQDVVQALKAFRKSWSATKLAADPTRWEDHDLLFCTALGRPLNPNNIARNYERIISTLNAERRADDLPEVPRIRIHDLRHTHATLLLQEGVPVKVVSERLGHANIAITLNTYAHVLPDMQDQAVAAFAAMLAREESAI